MRKDLAAALSIFIGVLCCAGLSRAQEEGPATPSFQDPPVEGAHWVPPPPVDANSRNLSFELSVDLQHDALLKDQAFSMLDLKVQRPLDENAILAEGEVRFRKSLSNSDSTQDIDLRLARISYLEPWLQVTLGRFDLFRYVSPGLFFGGYPLMGLHRVDGVWATVPFSFFFSLGPAKPGQAESSSPLALSFFYTPSLFSAQQVLYDSTQTFWLSQLRVRLEDKDFTPTLKANFGGSASDYFDYSSINGGYTASLSLDLAYRQNYELSAEWAAQNIDRIAATGVLALSFQASRLGTWGAFSLDQIALEAQFPLGQDPRDPFTGGNGLSPSLAQAPRTGWYGKVRARLRTLFFELHLTNNQDDYTLARPVPGSIGIPFTGPLGPGNETAGPGTSLRASSYDDVAVLLDTGVEF